MQGNRFFSQARNPVPRPIGGTRVFWHKPDDPGNPCSLGGKGGAALQRKLSAAQKAVVDFAEKLDEFRKDFGNSQMMGNVPYYTQLFSSDQASATGKYFGKNAKDIESGIRSLSPDESRGIVKELRLIMEGNCCSSHIPWDCKGVMDAAKMKLAEIM